MGHLQSNPVIYKTYAVGVFRVGGRDEVPSKELFVFSLSAAAEPPH